MIIICPRCLKKFNLDEVRLPDGGAKVRCSKYQHTFQVRRKPLGQPALSIEILPKEFPGALEKRSQRKRRARSHFPALTLLIVLLILTGMGYGSFVIWQKSADLGKLGINLPAFKQYLGLSDEPKGYISVENLWGYYLENAKSGKIFIIEGQAVNRWKESCSFIKVKGILLDAKGGKVGERVVYCGNILSEKDLKELDPEAIEKNLSSQFGISFSNVNIPRDKFVPFMIAFADSAPKIPGDKPSPEAVSKPGEVLPESSDFNVEVVSFHKGSK